MEYQPTGNSSWVWRRICVVKELLKPGFTEGDWGRDPIGFTTTGCYDWLRGEGQTWAWSKVIRNNWLLPKHKFIGWLVAHRALRTADKLISYGLDVDSTCLLCGMEEECSHHLFFECPYSRQISMELHSTTGMQLPDVHSLQWCLDRPGTKL
ncbi:hypothetical protein vseg_021037 [Gypsophila vaccaria]